MATNKPAGDNRRTGAVASSQLKTPIMGEPRHAKRSRQSGRFMDQKSGERKFKGVRKER
jgi:hypothetical protein